MAVVGGTRSVFPEMAIQRNIYEYWVTNNCPTAKLVSEKFNIPPATINKIITKGLQEKWHN